MLFSYCTHFSILKIYSYVLFINLCLMVRLLRKKYVVTIMYSINRGATVQWTLRRTMYAFFFFCEVAQSWPTLCDHMDCSLPGSSVHGIFQARILEWAAISFSRGSSQPRDRTWVSHIVGRCFYLLSHQGSPRTGHFSRYGIVKLISVAHSSDHCSQNYLCLNLCRCKDLSFSLCNRIFI